MLYYGLLLSMFLEYVRPGAFVPVFNALKLNTLVPMIVLAGAMFYKGPVSNGDFFGHRTSKWLLFFMALLGLSVMTSDVTFSSYAIFKLVLGFMVWYFIIVRLVTDFDKIRGLLTVLVISHVIITFLNPQVITNPEVRSYIVGSPFLGDGNDFSLSVAVVIPMCIFMLLNSRGFWLKLLFGASLLILVTALIGTQSRGATLALASTFLFLWWYGRRKMLGLTLIAVTVVAVLSYAPDVYFERLETIKDYKSEGSAVGRILAWKTAVRMAVAHPLLGVGAGHFAIKLGTEFRPPEFGNQNLPWLTAHSAYFLILGELGFPGIIALLALLGGNFLTLRRLYKQIRGSPDPELKQYASLFLMMAASVVAYSVASAFLSTAYYPHIYVLSGIIAACELAFGRRSEMSDGGRDRQEEHEERWLTPVDKRSASGRNGI